MSYLQKVLRRTGIALMYSLVAAVIAYLTRIVLARTLGPEQYGLFTSVFTFVIFFLFFRDLGFDISLVKYVTEFRLQNRNDKITTAFAVTYGFQFLSSLIFFLLFVVLAPFLSRHYFKNPDAASLLVLCSLYVLTSLCFLILKNFFQAFQRQGVYSSIDAVKNGLVLAFFALLFWEGVPAVKSSVLAYVLVGPVLLLLYAPTLFRTFPIFKYPLSEKRKILNDLTLFSIPVFFTYVGGKIIAYIDTIFLTYFRSLTEVGIYNVVLPSAMIFLLFGSALNSVLFPLLTELHEKKNQRDLVRGLILVHRYVPFLLIPILLSLVIFAKEFLALFFGQAYVSGTAAFELLLMGMIFMILASTNGTFLTALGKPASVTKIIFFAGGINVLCNFFFIPRFGIVGAAAATLISYFFTLILSTRAIVRLLQISFPSVLWLKLALSTLTFWFTAKIAKNTFFPAVNSAVNFWHIWQIFPVLLPAFLMYLLSAYLFNIPSAKELYRFVKMAVPT